MKKRIKNIIVGMVLLVISILLFFLTPGFIFDEIPVGTIGLLYLIKGIIRE